MNGWLKILEMCVTKVLILNVLLMNVQIRVRYRSQFQVGHWNLNTSLTPDLKRILFFSYLLPKLTKIVPRIAKFCAQICFIFKFPTWNSNLRQTLVQKCPASRSEAILSEICQTKHLMCSFDFLLILMMILNINVQIINFIEPCFANFQCKEKIHKMNY